MSDSKLTPPAGDAAMSVRECRLITERLLVAAGTLPGEVPAVRDAALLAEMLGLGVMAHLYGHGLHAPASAPGVRIDGATATVEAGGALSLYLVPALRDLIIVHPGLKRIQVNATERGGFLAVLDALPELAARTVAIAPADGAPLDGNAAQSVVLEIAAAAAPKGQEHVLRAHRDGLPVPGAVWLELYLRSNAALLEESALTRRHAGHQDVDSSGRIVRPMDDDVDIEHALAAAAN
ncbi:hypothetical protein GCM10023081_32430 [Arthrobacter ginkgonis]|uniref:Uncharacterized protein n=1 Tax=Arthrobacter ginkgonis TaxID=1630594 RepID=A0ABP7CKS8_9MICC